MPIRVNSDLQTILPAIKGKLTGDHNFPVPNVFLTLASEDTITAAPPTDRFVTVTPRDFHGDMGLAAGAGRNSMGIDGGVEVALWVRLATDQFPADDAFLTDPAHGVLPAWAYILQSLQLFDPADGSGNPILEEPMRLVRWSSRPRRARAVHAKLESLWEVKFIQRLDYPPLTEGGEMT